MVYIEVGISRATGCGGKAVIIRLNKLRQPCVCRFDIVDPLKTQFFYQPVLERLVRPLNATFCLGRVGMDWLYTQGPGA